MIFNKRVAITFFASLLAGSEIWAAATGDQDLKDLCAGSSSATIQKVHLNFVPSYFAKVFATKNYATLISDQKNYILDLNTGKYTQVIGTYDPVPTPDEKFIVSIKSNENLYWTTTKDIVDGWDSNDFPPKWAADNFDLSYAYQSVGSLKGQPKTSNYRLLTDNDKGDIYFKDVHFTPSDQGDLKKEDGWVRACNNVPGTFKLPMISKDGSHLSAYNINKERTEIFSVQANGSCKLEQTLPFATGKADFSFDGSKVTFHMGKYTEPKQWFEHDDPQYHLNVYVWDLKKKTLTQVTDTANGNSYFPTFRKNGTIGFLEAHHNNDSTDYYYVLANPQKGKTGSEAGALNESCNCHLNEYASAVGIGALRDQLCSSFSNGMTMENIAASTIALSKDQCEKLVTKYWDKFKDQIVGKIGGLHSAKKDDLKKVSDILEELPASAMLAACPSQDSKATVHESDVMKNVATDPKQILANSCSQCHTGNSPSSGHAFDLENLSNIPALTRQKMADRIQKGEMPPGGLPDQQQRKKLHDYILSIH